MYQGTINVAVDNLDNLLQLARYFQISPLLEAWEIFENKNDVDPLAEIEEYSLDSTHMNIHNKTFPILESTHDNQVFKQEHSSQSSIVKDISNCKICGKSISRTNYSQQ